jgi:4-hydroxyphenylpyruvate dioxygenase
MPDDTPDDWPNTPNPFGWRGFEFLEFATYSDAERDELTAAFLALGFNNISRHQSKDVTRFNQGNINFVLNREADCFARSFAMVHGASVCALGLRIDDAERAHAHALQHGAQDFKGSGRPGELAMPAIRGVFGSLIYYVDVFGDRGSIYDDDFRNTSGTAGFEPTGSIRAVGLDSIDHVSISVLPGRTPKWVDFFKDLLGFHDWSHNVIPDPDGTVVSNVVSSPCGGIHLPINESPDTGTAPNRFLTEYFGEGIQHIALQTPDILAAVKAIEENGTSLLPMPASVYEELAATGDHEADFVEELRAHNILIDTEGGGRFLHAYTQPICDRFFFEVVQRNDHVGFGKGNAGIRSQALHAFYEQQNISEQHDSKAG